MHRHFLRLILLVFPVACQGAIALAEKPDFTREVRPILARHCLKCHGPDDQARKGKLRLDVADSTRVAAKSGELAIVPGHTDRGTLLARIYSHDDSEVMPPPTTKNPLSDREKETLKGWIGAGAEYKQHWAFVAPIERPVPTVRQADWPINFIDSFILARLEAEGLHPSAAADRQMLIRRVYLDLIGLPPTPAEVDAFVADQSPDAYAKVVDRLLANPHYGERWARRWLDLARYADTNGYEKDRVRSIWPYRDWVIRALNADMPFDQFTVEQIAGDMLPGATIEQKIATGFHRNTMLNEEGGIDPLEFRWKAVVDRNNVTATTWLGLTLGCAQCHTHKFDPIPHREYYQMMAFLNNANEPLMPVPTPELKAARESIQRQISERVAGLAERFPVEEFQTTWSEEAPVSVSSAGGATAAVQPDRSILMSGPIADRETYTIVLDGDGTSNQLRLEVLKDPSLPHEGPGRADNGNFVVNRLHVLASTGDGGAAPAELKLTEATADFSQEHFAVSGAIGNDPTTGWAIDGPGGPTKRTAVFTFDPAGAGRRRFTIRLEQNFGSHHTLGRFRLSLGTRAALAADRPIAERRHELLERSFSAWEKRESAKAVAWTVVRPDEMKGNVPLLTGMDDGSVFVSGDQTKRDVYDLVFANVPAGTRAIRLEAIPDERLPGGGPGRVYYEGPPGSFFLSALTMSADGKALSFAQASQTFAEGNNTAAGAIDADPLTGWAIGGGTGKAQTAVFTLAEPLEKTRRVSLSMVFEKYYSAPLGRFRISVSSDPRATSAPSVATEIEALLAMGPEQRTAAQNQQLFQYYLTVAPELAAEQQAIEAMRKSVPTYPTTLVIEERPARDARATYIHHRGEYLQPTEKVEANVLSILPPLPAGAAHDRLSFARWLVDRKNPLTARVTVNRQWAAFFGEGIVGTLGDFGYQGDTPTHPELLDALAVRFMDDGWSLKKLHRLIVMSATYRQSSAATPELIDRDPRNRLLARGPRFRMEAELVRDYALRASGLLSEKIGGPSVFPPQPASVTTEGAYGALAWNVSTGEDRYRRGLYTFAKRTAPYAAFNAFDAPSGEACVARRDVSDSPLQALTLLNDEVFVEADQHLGGVIEKSTGDETAKATTLFRQCLCRAPASEEVGLVVQFYRSQLKRFSSGELDPMPVAGSRSPEAAAWTATARSLLNLDEAVTKE